MTTTLLMFIAAILLSAIAGYYSVIGMTAIFSGAFIPVLLMSGTLEASKVIVASWLYNNWKKTPLLLKSYLTAAVVILMFITSMGIFGFLSKAHIQHAASGAQTTAQIERLQQEIETQKQIVEMSTKRIQDLMSGGQGGDAGLNARIAQANKVIDSANARVQPKIDEQQKIIDAETAKVEARVSDIQTQIADVDKQVSALDEIIKGLVDQQRSVLAQKKRAEQSKERDALAKRKAELLKQIDDTRNAPNQAIETAKAEIAKIRSEVETEVTQARSVINGLTAELGKNIDTSKIQQDIDEQNNRIKIASSRMDELTTEKFNLETQNRQLEVEVGPIKYIAQLIYGDTVDMNMLERAVRYMIIILIFVFDPLAVLMLIASNQGLSEWKNARRKMKPQSSIRNEDSMDPVAHVSSKTDIDNKNEYAPIAKVDDEPNGVIIDNDMMTTADDQNIADDGFVSQLADLPQSESIDDRDDLLTKLKRRHATKLQRLGFNITDSER